MGHNDDKLESPDVPQGIERCARCILPTSLPSVELDEAGVCTHCRAYDLLAAELERTQEERKEQLSQLIRGAQESKSPYDCVVPLSGGKDSTYALYLCSQVYGLRCLCATLDNGYLTEGARANIENALQATGADHMVYRMNRATMLDLYGLTMRNAGEFCVACNRGIEVAIRAVAQAFSVPLVMTGHGKRPTYLSDGRMPEVFQGGSLSLFKQVIGGERLDGRADPFLVHGYERPALSRLSHGTARLLPQGLPRRAWSAIHTGARKALRGSGLAPLPGPKIIELYDYVDVNEAEIKATLVEQMGWNSMGKVEHLDCAVAEIKLYVQMLKYPDLMPNTIRHSGWVRAGRMGREEALELERRERAEPWEPAMLEPFLADLGLSHEEFEELAVRAAGRA
ncbi:MAG: hypothetical protein JXM73_05980 [Anaerolineae bacterium]|nr:hypothetical protein [Anaerolineae bacterium]